MTRLRLQQARLEDTFSNEVSSENLRRAVGLVSEKIRKPCPLCGGPLELVGTSDGETVRWIHIAPAVEDCPLREPERRGWVRVFREGEGRA